MELVLLHSTVNIVRRMQQATTMLLVAAAFNIMLKAAFNIFVEGSTNRMQHFAVLPQWNTALIPAKHVRGNIDGGRKNSLLTMSQLRMTLLEGYLLMINPYLQTL